MTKMSSLTDAATILAQAAPAQPGGAAQMFAGMLPAILLMGGFYFLFIAPQRKKQKEHEKMVSELKSGDEIITTGGIYGTITSVKDDRLTVRIGDNNTKVELAKGFINAVVKKSDAA